MAVPLALALLARSANVQVVVEGIAIKEFEQAGFNPVITGPLDFQKEHFNYNPATILQQLRPSVVVVGRSYPFNMEEQFARTAFELGIPLVLLQDYPGVHAIPDEEATLVLVAQEFADTPLAGNVKVVGNHAVSMADVPVPPQAAAYFSGLRTRFEEIFMFACGDPEAATAELELFVAGMKNVGGSWCLLTRYHPKHRGDSRQEKWAEVLATLGERVLPAEPKELDGLSGEQLLGGVDVLVSGRSTLLVTAAARGIRAISLRTPITLRQNKEILGLEDIPMIRTACAIQVSEPKEMAPALEVEIPRPALQAYDPDLAAHLVLRLKT